MYKRETHSRRSFAAALAVLVVGSVEPVDAVTVLAHAFAQSFEEEGAFEAHFTDAAHQAHFAEAVCVIAFFDFVHASFEVDAFVAVGGFHGRREGWRYASRRR